MPPSKSSLKKDNTICLSQREIEILQLLYQGLSSKKIGAKLFISSRTVDDYRQQLMLKSNTHNVTGLIRFGLQNGLITVELENEPGDQN
jgi:two-component system, NarL family, nitrate/nitrite response regulator NarL